MEQIKQYLEQFRIFCHQSLANIFFVDKVNGNAKEKNENAHQATSNQMIKHSRICLLHITSLTNPKKFLTILLNIPIHMNSISLS